MQQFYHLTYLRSQIIMSACKEESAGLPVCGLFFVSMRELGEQIHRPVRS